MTTPVFPAALPKPSMQSYGYTPGNNLLRTEMDTGAARVRRRFIAVPTEVSVQWSFTQAEFATFEAFYRNGIYDGAAWFTMPIVKGDGEVMRLARFKEPYKAATEAREHLWSVTATLEVMEQ